MCKQVMSISKSIYVVQKEGGKRSRLALYVNV